MAHVEDRYLPIGFTSYGLLHWSFPMYMIFISFYV
jgi:hypothetical protein